MGGRGAHAYNDNNQVAWDDYLYAQEIQMVQKDYEICRTSLKSDGGGGRVALKKRCACCGQLSLPAMRFVNILVEDMIVLSELVAKGHWKKTKGLKVNFRAGGVTELESGQDFAFQQATGDLSWLAEHISYYRAVINDIYKVNLFLTLTMNLDRTKTATEVAGLSQEREVLMHSTEPSPNWIFMNINGIGRLQARLLMN